MTQVLHWDIMDVEHESERDRRTRDRKKQFVKLHIKTISGGNPIKETKSQKRIISLKFRDGTLLQFKSNQK